MSDGHQYPVGRRVSLPGHFAEPVVLESVRPLGEGSECRVRLTDGSLDEVVLSAEETRELRGNAGATEKSRLVDPADLQVLVESARIRLAYSHDRQFAVIGGVSPSEYLAKLEKGDAKTPPIDPTGLDVYLASHLIDPALLRTDSFEAFMADRQKRLLELIERATGKAAYSGDQPDEGEDIEGDEDTIEAELTISAE
jgi:hypothetical protein